MIINEANTPRIIEAFKFTFDLFHLTDAGIITFTRNFDGRERAKIVSKFEAGFVR